MMPERKRTALITGGSRGIGLGIAGCLAAEGFNLVLNGTRSKADTTQALEKLRGIGAQVHYCQADISTRQGRLHLIDEARRSFGRLDLLVNNAGVAPKERADILEASEDSFDRLIGINLKGPYFLTQAVANWMIQQKKEFPDFAGCIVHITSISAVTASVNRGDYCLTKAALSMASKLWAVRLAEFAIPVYEVRPGIVRTDMTAGVQEKYDKLIANGLLLQARWGLPEDVGRAVAMLARGELAYSTGQVIMVDGGYSVERL